MERWWGRSGSCPLPLVSDRVSMLRRCTPGAGASPRRASSSLRSRSGPERRAGGPRGGAPPPPGGRRGRGGGGGRGPRRDGGGRTGRRTRRLAARQQDRRGGDAGNDDDGDSDDYPGQGLLAPFRGRALPPRTGIRALLLGPPGNEGFVRRRLVLELARRPLRQIAGAVRLLGLGRPILGRGFGAALRGGLVAPGRRARRSGVPVQRATLLHWATLQGRRRCGSGRV